MMFAPDSTAIGFSSTITFMNTFKPPIWGERDKVKHTVIKINASYAHTHFYRERPRDIPYKLYNVLYTTLCTYHSQTPLPQQDASLLAL